MRRVLAFLAVATVLAGCVSTHMKQYMGKDVRYVVVDNGPPMYAFDMGDGRRAFQWPWGGGTYHVPEVESATTSGTAIGPNVWLTRTKIKTGGHTVTSEGCIITYFARWDERREAWFVVDYSYPKRLVC